RACTSAHSRFDMAIIIQCPNPSCGASLPEASPEGNIRCEKCGKVFLAGPSDFDGKSEATKSQSDTANSRPPVTANPFPELPAEFGRYQIKKLLGQGGMGAVYLAEDSELGRSVALKIPFFEGVESAQRIERFVREARSAAALHHPNICTVFDSGRIDGRPFI